MILKLDLEKAYDRVSWEYLDRILLVLGFNAPLRKLIMEITTTTTLQIAWNRKLLDGFRPSRGLWQGDPLSPYMFVLCMEVLGQEIERVVEAKQWKPVRLTKNGQPLSHLFFADDLMLFGLASFSQATLMEHIVSKFSQLSGQKVNREKSRIWFAPATPSHLRNTICSSFQIKQIADLGVYF